MEAKRNIGFLPQKPPLYMDFTVDEYLTYCADLRMVDKMDVKKAVDEAKPVRDFTFQQSAGTEFIGRVSTACGNRAGDRA